MTLASPSPDAGVSVIIPAYEEEDGIEAVIAGARGALASLGAPWEIIVVDDGSNDATGKRASGAGALVVRHDENRGYGAALKTGIRRARYDIVLITDADGTYPAESIPTLIDRMGGYDMAVGARTGADVNIPAIRKPAKWFIARFAGYVAGRRIPDLNSGFRAFRRADALEFFHMLPDGFSFTTTLTLAMITSSYNVSYVPVDYRKRVGKSKISPIADTIAFCSLVFRMALYFRPLRVFLPFAGTFAAATVAKVAYDAVVYEFSLRGTTLALMVVTLQTFLLAFVAALVVAQRRPR